MSSAKCVINLVWLPYRCTTLNTPQKITSGHKYSPSQYKDIDKFLLPQPVFPTLRQSKPIKNLETSSILTRCAGCPRRGRPPPPGSPPAAQPPLFRSANDASSDDDPSTVTDPSLWWCFPDFSRSRPLFYDLFIFFVPPFRLFMGVIPQMDFLHFCWFTCSICSVFLFSLFQNPRNCEGGGGTLTHVCTILVVLRSNWKSFPLGTTAFPAFSLPFSRKAPIKYSI